MSIRFPKWCKTPEQRSAHASRVASIRWEKFHADNPREYPPELPDLMARITLEIFWSGQKHVFELHRCSRLDQFRVTINGRMWLDAVGLSRILAGIRKSLTRERTRNFQ